MKIKRIIIIFLIFFFPYFLLAQTDHHEWIKEQNKYFTSFKKKHFKTQYHDKEDIKKEYLKMEYPSEHFEEIKKTFGKRNKLFSMIEELINRKKSNNIQDELKKEWKIHDNIPRYNWYKECLKNLMIYPSPTPTPTTTPEINFTPTPNSNSSDFIETIEKYSKISAKRALELLEYYLDSLEAKRIEEDDSFDETTLINKEFLGIICGLIYSISKDKKLFDSGHVKDVIKKIFTPLIVWDFDKFKSLVRALMNNPEKLKEFIDKLNEFDSREKEVLLKLLYNIGDDLNKDDYMFWNSLFDFAKSLKSKQHKKLWEEFLPRMNINNMKSLVEELRDLLSVEKEIRVYLESIYNDDEQPILIENRELLENFKNVLREKFILSENKNDEIKFKIQHIFSRSNKDYHINIHFYTAKSNLLIFSDSFDVTINDKLLNVKDYRSTCEKIIQNFFDLLDSLKIITHNKKEISLDYNIRDMETIISYKIVEETRISNFLAKDEIKKEGINVIYLDREYFWEKKGKPDTQALKIFGNEIPENVKKEINEKGITNQINVKLGKPINKKHYFYVYAEYQEIAENINYKDTHCQVNIFYKITNSPFKEDIIYIDNIILKENIDQAKNNIESRILLSLEELFDLPKRQIPEEKIILLPNNTIPKKSILGFFSNFFLPGLRCTYNNEGNMLLTIWNYSNIVFLGAGLLSEYIFFMKNYSSSWRWSYYSGLACLGTFIVNGLISGIIYIIR